MAKLALWLNESKNGVKYFSAAFSKPYQAEVEQGGIDADNKAKEAMRSQSDDLPF
jgi:hypothetical protein